jgi:hypothetical protein
MTFNPAALDVRVAIEGSNSRTGEEGGADIANQTADTVNCKDIESVVDSEEEFELGSIVRASGAYNTKDDSSPRRDISCYDVS